MATALHDSVPARRRGGLRPPGLAVWLAVMLTIGLSAAGPAHAADLAAAADPTPPAPPAPAVRSPSAWRYQATLYGWLTAINGNVGVRRLPSVAVDASISDVLRNLDGGLMGSFLARNDQWLVMTDLVLARLSHDGQVGAYGRSALDATISQTIASAAVGYWLPLGMPNVDLGVTAGLRYVRLSSDVTLTPQRLPFGYSGSSSAGWLDPTVGFAANWRIDDRWFVNALADIGGFGAGSKLSSSGYLGVGYMWTPSISTAVGYRYLYENYESGNGNGGSFRYNTTMHGPTVSVAWHF